MQTATFLDSYVPLDTFIKMSHKDNISTEEIECCIQTLTKLNENASLAASIEYDKLLALTKIAGRFSRPNKDEIYKQHKAFYAAKRRKKQIEDRLIRNTTGIREARAKVVFEAPAQITSTELTPHFTKERVLKSARNCYICKKKFLKLHFFYDSMCMPCAAFNYKKRFQSVPLQGQVALITGSRLKIGYQTSLKLLRAGARVIATTRFPIDAALRFSNEADFSIWNHRLEVYGLDLRHLPSVEIFSRLLCKSLDRLDILINNAAQTVRRPPGFYSHLMENEKTSFAKLSPQVQKILESSQKCKSESNVLHSVLDNSYSKFNTQELGIGLKASALLSQIPYQYDPFTNTEEIFPANALDSDLQQVDLRKINSWRLKLADVSTHEMLEVQLVNAVAPFILCSKLIPLMSRDYTGKKHIVNVSAMEGKFHRFKKGSRHPHTNMAKAALNMLTHTSASDLARKGIFMNAVDTGWVTDEDPIALSTLKQERHDFQPPLDIVDGAARICDPFFDGILTGKHWCGKFLKDYKPIDW